MPVEKKYVDVLPMAYEYLADDHSVQQFDQLVTALKDGIEHTLPDFIHQANQLYEKALYLEDQIKKILTHVVQPNFNGASKRAIESELKSIDGFFDQLKEQITLLHPNDDQGFNFHSLNGTLREKTKTFFCAHTEPPYSQIQSLLLAQPRVKTCRHEKEKKRRVEGILCPSLPV